MSAAPRPARANEPVPAIRSSAEIATGGVPKRFLSIRETAELLGVSRGVVERRKCELGAIEIGRNYRIPIEGLELWLRRNRVRNPNANAQPALRHSDELIRRARREVGMRGTWRSR